MDLPARVGQSHQAGACEGRNFTDVVIRSGRGRRSLRVIDLPNLLGDMLPRLPVCLRRLFENHVRSGGPVEALLRAVASRSDTSFEFVFRPDRFLMLVTACTPTLANIAGLRDALAEAG